MQKGLKIQREEGQTTGNKRKDMSKKRKVDLVTGGHPWLPLSSETQSFHIRRNVNESSTVLTISDLDISQNKLSYDERLR